MCFFILIDDIAKRVTQKLHIIRLILESLRVQMPRKGNRQHFFVNTTFE